MDLLFEGRVASAVEITPIEAVVTTASLLFLVEQGAKISARLAAIGTISTGIAMVPIGAKKRD